MSLFNLSDLHLGDFRGFQRDLVNGLALAGVGHGGVDLGRGDVLVAKDMLDGIDAGAGLRLFSENDTRFLEEFEAAG